MKKHLPNNYVCKDFILYMYTPCFLIVQKCIISFTKIPLSSIFQETSLVPVKGKG